VKTDAPGAENKVVAEGDEPASDNSMNYTWYDAFNAPTGGYGYVSQIAYLANETLGTVLMNNAADKDWSDSNYGTATVDNKDYTLYALAKFTYKNLWWNTFKETTTLPAGTFYIRKPKTAAPAPEALEVIWLDGTEENTTGIETVNVEKQNNAEIYNLAGQKVGADFKGVVIKNGKKFFQK
jgi:hypothetical protein